MFEALKNQESYMMRKGDFVHLQGGGLGHGDDDGDDDDERRQRQQRRAARRHFRCRQFFIQGWLQGFDRAARKMFGLFCFSGPQKIAFKCGLPAWPGLNDTGQKLVAD